jgi:hypothetical protein
MEQIPDEWIDKLFSCLSSFYREKWDKHVKDKFVDSLLRTMWKNGLHGLSKEQIRNGLKWCKKHSENINSIPPHVMNFYMYCLDRDVPMIHNRERKCNPEISRKYISIIKKNLS